MVVAARVATAHTCHVRVFRLRLAFTATRISGWTGDSVFRDTLSDPFYSTYKFCSKLKYFYLGQSYKKYHFIIWRLRSSKKRMGKTQQPTMKFYRTGCRCSPIESNANPTRERPSSSRPPGCWEEGGSRYFVLGGNEDG